MKFILLLLIISSSHLGYSQKPVKSDSTIKASKAIIELEDAKAIFKKKKSDSTIRTSKTIIELEDAKTIFKEKKNDWWDKYSNGLIAAVTVFVSLGISIWQARSSQKHTKANIISEARIEWIQKLRPHLGELISNTSMFSDNFRDLYENYIDSKTKKRRTDLTDEEEQKLEDELKGLTSQIYKITETFNQVKLFLNRKEPEHLVFIESVDKFLAESFEVGNLEVNNIDDFEDDLILKAQVILKNAWTQAKFGDKKAQKIIEEEKKW